MPIVIAIIFAIGLALSKPEKLAQPLRLLRQGIIFILYWGIRVGAIAIIIGVIMWAFNFFFYDDYKKEQAKKQFAIDSLAQAQRDSIRFLEDRKLVVADSLYQIMRTRQELKYEQIHSQAVAESLIASWSRTDVKVGTFVEPKGEFTFKRGGTFYSGELGSGSYKLDDNAKTLYLYYDSGESESLSIVDAEGMKIKTKPTELDLVEVTFIKKPKGSHNSIQVASIDTSGIK